MRVCWLGLRAAFEARDAAAGAGTTTTTTTTTTRARDGTHRGVDNVERGEEPRRRRRHDVTARDAARERECDRLRRGSFFLLLVRAAIDSQ
jgi:hypothetical protein